MDLVGSIGEDLVFDTYTFNIQCHDLIRFIFYPVTNRSTILKVAFLTIIGY